MTVWSFNSGGLRKRRFTEATHSGGRGGWRAGWPDRPAPVDDPDCCLNRVPTRRSRRVTVRPPTSSTPGSARRPLIPGPSSRGLPPRWAARSIGTAPPSRPRRIGRPWGPSLSAAACSTAAVKVRRTACAYPMEGVADTHTAGGPLSPSIPLSLSPALSLSLSLSLSLPLSLPLPLPLPRSLSLALFLSLSLSLSLPPPSLPPSRWAEMARLWRAAFAADYSPRHAPLWTLWPAQDGGARQPSPLVAGADARRVVYVRSREVFQRTKADQVGLRGLLHPLPLPSSRGGVIGVDWLLGLDGVGLCTSTTSPARSTPRPPAPLARTWRRMRRGSSSRVEMALRSGDGVPDGLVDHGPKFTWIRPSRCATRCCWTPPRWAGCARGGRAPLRWRPSPALTRIL